jgi:hypothetical protein
MCVRQSFNNVWRDLGSQDSQIEMNCGLLSARVAIPWNLGQIVFGRNAILAPFGPNSFGPNSSIWVADQALRNETAGSWHVTTAPTKRSPGKLSPSASRYRTWYSQSQDHPESKQILAKLAGKNQHLRKTNISEVGSLCSVKSMGYNMYRKKIHRWTEWPRGQSEYKIIIIVFTIHRIDR